MSKGELDIEQLSERLLDLQDSKKEEYGSTTHSNGVPENYLTRSLLALLACCPCGLLAVINAMQVHKKSRSGDVKGADLASSRAYHYSTVAFQVALVFFGLVGLVLGCIVLFWIFFAIDVAHMGRHGFLI